MTLNIQIPRFGLSLLGRFALTTDGRTVHLPSKKLAALLAYLACTAPQPQPREKLANLLWGSHFDTQARQNLRQALFRLRRILGEDALVGSDDEVRLAPGMVDCDALRFKALIAQGSPASLAAAADLYRGPLLTDLNIAEDAWSDWRASERHRLEDMAVDAMIRHGQRALHSGNAGAALKAAHRAIQLNALREDAHRLVIQALAATGRKAEALRHHQDFVALLKRELSTEPDAATQSLVAGLRGATLPGTSPVAALETSVDPTPGPKTEAVVERDGGAMETAVRRGAHEQRQLTIMVCNPTGPMTLSAGLDAEDIHDRIAAFHDMVADIAARFGGFVAQYQGNGMLVYFGYPAAHEHDAERAVRAGLAIRGLISQLSPDATFQASIGIATGLVVIGEKPGDTRQHVAIGETPDLAARLQAVATPGEILVAAGTLRLVGRMFDCRPRPAIEVQGLSQPVEAWRVDGEAAGVSRFDARRGATLSPFLGRQEEIELLLRRWDQAKAGGGRIVAVSGEPGIGKSRIAESLLARLEGEPHARFRYFCSPHHAHSALHPFIDQLERDANFEPGDSAGTRLDRLEVLLKPTTTNLPRDVAVIAELLGVPTDGRYPVLTASPRQKREMVLGALINRLYGAASREPMLIVFEDAHWIDPTSLDLLQRMVTRAADLPVLLIVTFRPDFQPMWVGQLHVTTLPLNRLGQRDSAGIIGGITQHKPLPDDVVGQILERADGVPLFIEELTRTLLEGKLWRETVDGYVLDGPIRAVPTTLQDSLVARLDRLGPARDVAMIGAVIGREFSHELIASVSALNPMDLDGALARLAESGLISRRGTPPATIYAFKHALVQDAAYATLLKGRRRQLHADIAKVLVEQFPALADNQPEIVAHHYTQARLASEAIGYWVKAGRLAHARWANQEAARFFEQALHAVETLPETRETLEQAIDLRFDLKTALIPLGAFERILGHLRQVEGLARKLGDKRRLCQFSIHMCQILGLNGNPRGAIAFGEEAKLLAGSLADVSFRVAAALFLGTARFSTMDYPVAEQHFLNVLDLLDGELSLEQFSFAGLPAASAHGFLTGIHGAQGRFKSGIVHGEEGIRLAQAADHPYSLAIACWCLADLLATKGELGHAAGLSERGLTVAREWNLPSLAAGASGSLGHVYALLGRTAEGLPLLERALSVFEQMRHRFAEALFLVPLGEAYLLAGRPAEALEFAGRALALARDTGQRNGEAGALRLLGEISVREDTLEHAEGRYREALALAVELEMSPLAARCHHGLGKLFLRGSQWDQARDQLTAATTMYREMDMRFWLDQANAEMRQLQ
ncbi:MAG: AAA family ATPase [Mesorhizobium sp.]